MGFKYPGFPKEYELAGCDSYSLNQANLSVFMILLCNAELKVGKRKVGKNDKLFSRVAPYLPRCIC